MVISHAEEKALVGEGVMNEGFTSTLLGLKGIPRVAEDIATVRDLLLAEYTSSPIHIAHVSTQGLGTDHPGGQGARSQGDLRDGSSLFLPYR